MPKITEIMVKTYKPEILYCPKCEAKLKYCYAVSNKVVQFTSGKYFRIKNLGYKCPKCNDNNVYFSQTATKLAFKGCTYSAKVVCMIDYYRTKHVGREKVCDILATKGIEISDRNVDMLYNKYQVLSGGDYDKNIHKAYAAMRKEFKQVRISLDLITINEFIYVILYDYFTSNLLALWKFGGVDDPKLIPMLKKYIPIDTTVIASTRNVNRFLPIVKEVVAEIGCNARFIAYQKYTL